MKAVKEAWGGLLKPVFVPASIIIFVMIAFSVVYSSTAADSFDTLNKAITSGVG